MVGREFVVVIDVVNAGHRSNGMAIIGKRKLTKVIGSFRKLLLPDIIRSMAEAHKRGRDNL